VTASTVRAVDSAAFPNSPSTQNPRGGGQRSPPPSRTRAPLSEIRANHSLLHKRIGHALHVNREVVENITQIPIILPSSLLDPSRSFFRPQEVTGWYYEPSFSLFPVLHGYVEGNPPPLLTGIEFYPFPKAECAVKEFVFTAIGNRVGVSQSFELRWNETLGFNFSGSLPVQEFRMGVLSNEGDSFTCVPPFELYGLVVKIEEIDEDQRGCYQTCL
jgi:hypothetical protein